MVEDLIQVIVHTPVWVWPLFVALVYFGYKCSKTRQIRVRTLFLVPALYLFLSVRPLIEAGGALPLISAWLGGAGLGVLIGWVTNEKAAVKLNYEVKMVEIPGEWMTLSLMMAFFAVRYYYGYKLASAGDTIIDESFYLTYHGIFGAFTGYFIGRTAKYIQKLMANPTPSS